MAEWVSHDSRSDLGATLWPQLIEAAPDALIVVSGDGRIRLVNRQVEVLFGYQRAELEGQPVEMLIPERYGAGHVPLREAFVVSPAVRPMGHNQILYARRKDGSEFPAEISLSPVELPGERLVTAAVRDATDRQAAAREQERLLAATEAAEERFRQLLEGAPDAMVVVGDDGRITLVNRQLEVLFDYDREELIGQRIEVLLPERLRAQHRPLRDGYMGDPHARPMGAGLELVARRRDGTQFSVEVSLSPVTTLDGVLVSAAIRDVSAQRMTAAALRRQAALLDLVPAAVLVRDAEGGVRYWNRAAEGMYGWKAEEVMGRKVHDVLHTQFPVSIEERDEALTTVGGWEGEVEQTTKDGHVITCWSSQVVERDEHGGLTGVLQVNTNITAAKAAARELEETAQDLRRSNAELEQFAYVASHDLQEPLRMVSSYTQLLGRRYRGKLDEDADEFIAFAVDGAQRMQALIQDLLTYSRVGTHGVDLAPIELGEVLTGVLSDLAPAMEEASATVASEQPLPRVLGDAQQMHSLFQNLIGNALKYRGAEAPRVKVRATRRESEWEIAVEDNGIGMDPAYGERIFVLFQRLHSRDEYSGTGIGLAVCKKIVERHGGRIWVETQLGAGSTFHFTLQPAD